MNLAFLLHHVRLTTVRLTERDPQLVRLALQTAISLIFDEYNGVCMCVKANGPNLIRNNDLYYSHHISVVSQASTLSAFLPID